MSVSVVLNGRFLTMPPCGVRRYASEIARLLNEILPSGQFLIAAPPDAPEIHDLPLQRWGFLKDHLWEQIQLPAFLRTLGQPLLISPANTGPLSWARQVVVLHDLAWQRPNLAFNRVLSFGYSFLLPRLLRRCKAVWTVSRFSSQEIHKAFSFLPEAPEVLYPSLGYLNAYLLPPRPDNLPEGCKSYFLVVGLTTHRKNATVLWEAFRLRPHFYLVVAGFSRRALRDCPAPPPNIHFLKTPTDDELARLYAHCKAVISASVYEGFDLPPVEGAFYGAPALLSDIPIHREIWEEEARYFAPWDAPALARLLDAPPPQSSRVAQRFTPDKIKSRLGALLQAL